MLCADDFAILDDKTHERKGVLSLCKRKNIEIFKPCNVDLNFYLQIFDCSHCIAHFCRFFVVFILRVKLHFAL